MPRHVTGYMPTLLQLPPLLDTSSDKRVDRYSW